MKSRLTLTAFVCTLMLLSSLHLQAQEIASGGGFNMFLCSNSTLYCTGKNGSGELGNGTNLDSNIPVEVSGLTDIVAISAGNSHSMAIKNDGTVWTWGFNLYGQLGVGTYAASNVPLLVSDLSDIVALSGGYEHSLALKGDGTVWGWGDNSNGQLGTGILTMTNNTPVQVSELTGVVGIAAGNYNSLGLKNDGTVWSWGQNTFGQLGTGDCYNYNVPVQVINISGITAIASGYYHCLALQNDGTVWAWGGDQYGQLGDDTTAICIKSPQNVPVLTGITAIAAGGSFSLALKNDGTVWSWGGNYFGQLGNGTNMESHVPIQVEGLTDVIKIAAGFSTAIAVKNDGSIWVWGNYELPGRDTTAVYLPTQLSDVCGVTLATHDLTTTENNLVVYPNPAHGVFSVQIPAQGADGSIEIYNTLGERIYSATSAPSNGSENTVVVDISTQPKGIYYIRCGEKVEKILLQ